MSFLNEFVDGVASDVLSAVTERLSYTAASKLIETCCQELGWAIDERPSPGRIALHFNDRVTRIRTVLVSIIERGAMVSFTVGTRLPCPQKKYRPTFWDTCLSEIAIASSLGTCPSVTTARPASRSTIAP